MGSLVMTGGGTLGHCAPNLAVYPYLKGRFDKIYYIGTVAGPERKAVEGIMEYMPITATKLIRSFSLKNLAIPLKLTKGVREATAAIER
ncbi:MAG: glycosyltransferase, partial [Clostridia bacterium]|nr:glycosyltransferase [Clostridia bacterium]